MAIRPTISKHNMIANLDKTNENVDFHAIIDFLTGSTINYSLLVDPDVIGPWVQQFWETAREVDDSVIQARVVGRLLEFLKLL